MKKIKYFTTILQKLIVFFLLIFFSLGLNAQNMHGWEEWVTDTMHFTDLQFADTNIAYGNSGEMILYRTTNHGKTWKQLRIAPCLRVGAMSFLTPAVGYVVTARNNVKIKDKNGNLIADTARLGIYQTLDTGNTWKRMNPGSADKMHFYTKDVGFIISSGYVGESFYCTNDAAKNLMEIATFSGGGAEYYIAKNNILYLTGKFHLLIDHDANTYHDYTRLYRSLDSGRYVVYPFDDVQKDDASFDGLYFQNDTTAFMNITDRFTGFNVYKTTDKAFTFKFYEKYADSKGEKFYINNDTGYIVNSTTYITTDAGLSWQLEFNDSVSHFGNMFLHKDGYLYKIRDRAIDFYKKNEKNGKVYRKKLYNVRNGIEGEQKNVNEIKIYPNPTNAIINIQSNQKIINSLIYDVTGKMLESRMNNNQLDISNFPRGIYILKLTDRNNLIKQFKVIKN